MKPILSTFIVFLAILVAACAPLQTDQPASVDLPTVTVMTVPAVEGTSQGRGTIVEVSTAIVMPPATEPTAADNGTGAPSGSALPTDGVTFSDNGSTFVMHVGESFLLNLGSDVYDWTVEVKNQDVLHRELNVMPIRGAQGIYIAEKPGTAVLTATGNPPCRQSTPPCMMPSILFSITVIVE